MMGLPDTQSDASHLYPQDIQLKLYQAFIFSIPILFSIILFLLFYLFYLKRRASILSSPPVLPTSSNQATTYIHSTCEHIGLKGEIKDRLPIILFDEELRTRDSQCCVCLGEFEIKEELLQVPSCKHVFHVQCLHHWLHSNTTCPLCRCSIVPVSKLSYPTPASGAAMTNQNQQEPDGGGSSVSDILTEQVTVHIEGLSSGSLSGSGRLPELSDSRRNEDEESVDSHIQNPNS